ncbi:MAG TPA: hypothetical protein PKD17_10685 [Cellvibrionaceae bacterium]|nr:hypothetical protein [Cellvibrionaceae bacterium]
MKMIANLALTILVEFFAASTFAAGASGAVKITNISVEGGQGVFINVDPRWALADCGAVNTSSGNTAFIPFSDPMFQAKYSAALTAFAANKNIGMWLSGCFTTNWGFNAHQMHSIGIAY